MVVTQGLRTFAEQDALYKQVPKVTNAKCGQSIHNYGLAFDFCLAEAGKTIWDVAKDFDGQRRRVGLDVIPTGVAVKRCYKTLKTGGMCAFLGDRDFSNTGLKVSLYL